MWPHIWGLQTNGICHWGVNHLPESLTLGGHWGFDGACHVGCHIQLPSPACCDVAST